MRNELGNFKLPFRPPAAETLGIKTFQEFRRPIAG